MSSPTGSPARSSADALNALVLPDGQSPLLPPLEDPTPEPPATPPRKPTATKSKAKPPAAGAPGNPKKTKKDKTAGSTETGTVVLDDDAPDAPASSAAGPAAPKPKKKKKNNKKADSAEAGEDPWLETLDDATDDVLGGAGLDPVEDSTAAAASPARKAGSRPKQHAKPKGKAGGSEDAVPKASGKGKGKGNKGKGKKGKAAGGLLGKKRIFVDEYRAA